MRDEVGKVAGSLQQAWLSILRVSTRAILIGIGLSAGEVASLRPSDCLVRQ
jgi:hypothetical protein